MRILMAASECFPLIKTGGLADVVGALPSALKHEGADVTVLLPGFPDVLSTLENKKTLAILEIYTSNKAKLVSGNTADGISIIALDAPEIFSFSGNPYMHEDGRDRNDNAIKFAAFSKVAAQLAAGEFTDKPFDILHAHDWQAALACAYLKAMDVDSTRSVLTIHNLAFQGVFPKETLVDLGLPKEYFHKDGLEYWGKVSYLKAGIVYSDHVTTVSPTYALEIQSDDGGMGLGGLLKSRGKQLSGILNGIDTAIWNPQSDPDIKANFSVRAISGKLKNKIALQKQLGLRALKDIPLFSVVSRLTTQKGLDVLARLVDHIVASGGQLVLLGSGDKDIENTFLAAAKKHPTEVSVQIGYDEALAHLIQAGSDAILIPSRFEPCGLTQLCAMRYGTVPVAARVGGLNDTIIDANPASLAKGVATGILFDGINEHTLSAMIDRTIDLYTDPKRWAQIRRNGLNQPVGWELSAKAYQNLYQALLHAD
ncbi:MAG: glycogen synthase GlgA [Gammaproteobacteria bacterium]|nr:glycogen synthase GlgA [Gammaproteobacteria bacterium]